MPQRYTTYADIDQFQLLHQLIAVGAVFAVAGGVLIAVVCSSRPARPPPSLDEVF